MSGLDGGLCRTDPLNEPLLCGGIPRPAGGAAKLSERRIENHILLIASSELDNLGHMEIHPFFHFYFLKVNVLLPLFNIWPAAVRAATSSLPEYWDNRLSIWTAVVEGFNMDTCKYYRMRSYEISQPQE